MLASRLPFLLALLATAAGSAADFPQPFNTEKDMSIPLMPAEEAAAVASSARRNGRCEAIMVSDNRKASG